MKAFLGIGILVLATTLAHAQTATKTTMANPAATFCIENGGEYQIRENADGSKYGVCVLSDGTEVDAWGYLRSHFEN